MFECDSPGELSPEEDCCCRQCQFELLGSKFYSPILSVVVVVVVVFSLPTTGGLGGGERVSNPLIIRKITQNNESEYLV